MTVRRSSVAFLVCIVLLALATVGTAATAAGDGQAGEYAGLNVICVGCSSGMGAGAAKILLRGGAKVVLSSRNQTKLDGLVKDHAGVGLAVAADAADAQSLRDLAVASREFFGAPVTGVIWMPTATAFAPMDADADTLADTIGAQMSVNVVGLLRLVKEVEDDLKATRGAVVSASSAFAAGPSFGALGYGVAKAAQEALVKNMALHFGQYGVRVNAVRLGAVLTEIYDIFGPAKPGVLKEFDWRTPLGRMGTVDEAAQMFTFLVGKRSTWTTGGVFDVDGGQQLFNSLADVYTPFLVPPDLQTPGHTVFVRGGAAGAREKAASEQGEAKSDL